MLNKAYDYTDTVFGELKVGDQYYVRYGVLTGNAILYTKIEPVSIGAPGAHCTMNATTGNGDNYFRHTGDSFVVKVTEKKALTFGDLKVGEVFEMRHGEFQVVFLKVAKGTVAVYRKCVSSGWTYSGVQAFDSGIEVERVEKLPDL